MLRGIKLVKPDEIERQSFAIISAELGGRKFPPGQGPVVKRVIHTTADFAYAEDLVFSPDAVERALGALSQGATLVTDTKMVAAGISQRAAEALGGGVRCFMGDPALAEAAGRLGVTRSALCMDQAASLPGPLILAIGNAPTALFRLCELVEEGRLRPELVIAVPVGFVNVVEAKQAVIASGVPHIVTRGRKGGSTVAAAICNALLYQVIDTSPPHRRDGEELAQRGSEPVR